MRRHVYFYTHVDDSYADLAAVLAGDPSAWLPAPARPSGDGWLVDLQSLRGLPGAMAAHTALVTVGEPSIASGSATLLRAVAWRSATAEPFVPVLEGDLELASLGGYGCHLSVMGSYRPPLSVAGEAGDRLFGHRIAEACVRRFVLDIADRLATSAALPA